jgi:hypothetical protein
MYPHIQFTAKHKNTYKVILLLVNNNMSGQPYRYAKDVENFRNEYMETLNTISNINDMNLQANKNYKETGALPPQSSMKDNRTTSEILADVEKLKLSIIGEFKGLCSPNMAMGVIQKVQASPLNGDGSFLTWLAQNAPELVAQLKRKYKFGIEGNENDVSTMYLFLQSIFSKTKEMNSSVKSAFDRPVGGLNGGLQTGDLDALKTKYDEIIYRLASSNTQTVRPTFMNLTREIRDKFDRLKSTISTAKYNQLRQIFSTTSTGTNNPTQVNINRLGYSEWLEFTDKLPSSSALNTLLDQLQKSERNANGELSIKILNNINSLLPSLSDMDKADRITDGIITTNGATSTFVNPANRPSVDALSTTGTQLNPVSGVANTPPTPPDQTGTPAQKTIMRKFFERVASFLNDVKNTPTLVQYYTRTSSNTRPSAEAEDALYQFCVTELERVESAFDRSIRGWKSTVNYDRLDMISALEIVTDRFNLNLVIGNTFNDESIATAVRQISVNSRTMTGAGIKKRAGRPKGSGIVKPLHERIDSNMGIKQGHTHVPFGRYLLNRNRLDEDIFSFKHLKGYGVRGYPSKRISRNLSNVFKTIVGGGTPKFDDLSNLSNDEKTYLHAVSKKAGIMDKISIPTPSKDSMDKDIHQFEVMKGEILAGNDSSVLIKNFKLLLLKLSKSGALPKHEVSEIMEDLLSLGY